MNVQPRITPALCAFLALLLTACGDSDTSSGASAEIAARNLVPADEQLKSIYNRSCRSCHTVAATQAPLTGDTDAWEERMQKGMPMLLDNVINGFGGMPPFGLCMDCDTEQFEALINFMALGK